MQRQTDSSGEAARARALALVRASSRFVLVGHQRPDGDCAGAQAALASALESLGKTVWIVNPDPLPTGLQHLARARRYEVHRGGALPAHDVCVLLDCSDPARCGALEPVVRSAPSRKLVVDHHPFAGQPFWDEAYLDTTASATGLLVHRMARALGATLDSSGALGVFTALVTDTGWFRYSNTDAETLALAADLVAGGVEPAAVYSEVFQRVGRGHPLGIARALARTRYHGEGRVAVIDLPCAAGDEHDLTDGDEVLDLLRAVDGVELALFLRETREGPVRLSARAKGNGDVLGLARRFGGGGHAKASGATLAGPLESARAAVVAAALESLTAAEVRSA
jgi:phosphoesterase RecJ-like protein